MMITKRNRAIFFVSILVLFVGSCIRSCIIDDNDRARDTKNGTPAKAVIINEKNYLPNSPVSHAFSYSYHFMVNGKDFNGDSGRPGLQIGDTIDIAYLKTNPNVNWPTEK